MRILCSFLIAALVAMFSAPTSAQSLYDPATGGLYGSQTQRQLDGGYSLQPWSTPDDSYKSFNRSLQDSRNRESVSDLLNRQRSDLRRREEQDRLQNEIRELESENRRLRAFRAQERDRQRRYDPASGIWSPARSQ